MKKIALIFSLLLLACAIAVGLWVWHSGTKQYDDAIANWHRHLSTISETRKEAIIKQLTAKQQAVLEIANNVNVKVAINELFAKQVDTAEKAARLDVSETMRLQDYLHSTAKQHGFDGKNTGLAIISNGHKPIQTQDFAKYQKRDVVIEGNAAYYYNIVPIKSFEENKVIGEIHGKYLLDDLFLEQLRKPDTLAKSDITSLVVEQEDMLYQLHGNGVIETLHDDTGFAEARYHPSHMVTEQGFTQIMHSLLPGVSLLHRMESNEITQPLEQNRKNFRTIGMLLAGLSLVTSLAGWLFATRKQEQTKASYQRKLVDKMVDLVDSRDHHSVKHSEKVSELSRKIASTMDAPKDIIQAAAIAGRLMNLGKVSLNKELLTKSKSLTEDEKNQITESFKLSSELVKDIPFDAPVYETLSKFPAPYEMDKDKILSAKIIKVANAYVAMSSPRAYRNSMLKGDIVKILQQDAGTKFDPKVVDALAKVI